MNTTIRLRIKKEIDAAAEKKVLKLKGSLIAKSFTDIIHIDDDGEEFYINYFTTEPSKKQEVINYTNSYITEEALIEIIAVI